MKQECQILKRKGLKVPLFNMVLPVEDSDEAAQIANLIGVGIREAQILIHLVDTLRIVHIIHLHNVDPVFALGPTTAREDVIEEPDLLICNLNAKVFIEDVLKLRHC